VQNVHQIISLKFSFTRLCGKEAYRIRHAAAEVHTYQTQEAEVSAITVVTSKTNASHIQRSTMSNIKKRCSFWGLTSIAKNG
jgi:hypothetical protein